MNKRFFIILLLWFAMSCSHTPSNRKWFDCNTVLADTTLIVEDWDRGAYLVHDSLVLSASLNPFNKGFCETIELRVEPIISYDGEHICSIGDLYPPFKIYKPNVSDTLTVIKNGRVIYFKIPEHLCE